MSATPASETQPVRLVAQQMADIQADPRAAVQAMLLSAAHAEDVGAQILLFPECFLTGYTRDPHIAEGRALDLSGAEFKALIQPLADVSPVVVFGLIERAGHALFNTAAVIDGGETVGVYRKRHPHESWACPGTSIPTFHLRGLHVGIGICADARSADDGAVLAGIGVDAVLYPLNNMLPCDVAERWRPRHHQLLCERALQTGASVLASDVVGRSGGQASYGATAACSPTQGVIALVPESETGMVVVDVSERRSRLAVSSTSAH